MITITYLNDAQQEATLSYDSYEDFERAQMTCAAPLADYYKVTKVSYNNHVLDYSGTFGNLFFYFLSLNHQDYK